MNTALRRIEGEYFKVTAICFSFRQLKKRRSTSVHFGVQYTIAPACRHHEREATVKEGGSTLIGVLPRLDG
jgi:hypothetical protein